MASRPAAPADNPRDLLSAVRDLTREVRRAQRDTWFPLLVLAAVNLAAIPVYRFAPHHVGSCRAGEGGLRVCSGYIPAVLVFWPVMLLLAYAAVARFAIRRASRRGVGTRVGPYVAVGVALAALFTGASVWRALHPLRLPPPDQVATVHPHPGVLAFATPATVIGVALLVLALVEANRALAAFGTVYLGVVVVQDVRVISSTSPWYFLPYLLVPATLLLLASGGFALARGDSGAQPR